MSPAMPPEMSIVLAVIHPAWTPEYRAKFGLNPYMPDSNPSFVREFMKITAATSSATTIKLQLTVRPTMVSTLSLPSVLSMVWPSPEDGGANSGICTPAGNVSVATIDESGSLSGNRTIHEEHHRAG